ncbi:MAG: hypothetical protein JOZ49_21640 [Mycolicibacterium sp.]|nr:hypothetical protein [Mycolicibacterium sp.]
MSERDLLAPIEALALRLVLAQLDEDVDALRITLDDIERDGFGYEVAGLLATQIAATLAEVAGSREVAAQLVAEVPADTVLKKHTNRFWRSWPTATAMRARH